MILTMPINEEDKRKVLKYVGQFLSNVDEEKEAVGYVAEIEKCLQNRKKLVISRDERISIKNGWEELLQLSRAGGFIGKCSTELKDGEAYVIGRDPQDNSLCYWEIKGEKIGRYDGCKKNIPERVSIVQLLIIPKENELEIYDVGENPCKCEHPYIQLHI